MDDIKYIKRLYEREGVSIREIMRRTGYHYETVRKYLDMEQRMSLTIHAVWQESSFFFNFSALSLISS